VAGRYQPLADDVTIAGDVRPNLSSAVGSEDKAKRSRGSLVSLRPLERSGRRTPAATFLPLQPEIVGGCPPI